MRKGSEKGLPQVPQPVNGRGRTGGQGGLEPEAPGRHTAVADNGSRPILSFTPSATTCPSSQKELFHCPQDSCVSPGVFVGPSAPRAQEGLAL